MPFNKEEFDKILDSTILRKYRKKMTNFKRYSKSDSKDRGKTPYHDYGVRWETGDISIRIFPNENLARVSCHVGHIDDFININYYDDDDFIENNANLIKELISDVKDKCLTSNKKYAW